MKSHFSPFKTSATVDGVAAEAVVFYGGSVKAAGIKDGFGILEGYLVVHDTPGAPEARDLAGQYFTKNTYLGPRDGDGADGTFHHTLAIPGIEFASERLFKPIKTKRDDIGVFCQIVLDMADDYERAVYQMGAKGAFGFSSGTAPHMIRCKKDGEITQWPILEGALTPTPCEPRARANAMKALEAATSSDAMKAFADEFKAIFESQEQAEEAFVQVVDALEDTIDENWRQSELIAIQREALLLQADIIRHSVVALRR